MDEFNPAPPVIMHVDINSCFATIEQQANPALRGKPVVVAAYVTGNGCILTASKEAKKLGIKTGMPVREARYIYPRLVVLPPDPDKYRAVNKQLAALLASYTSYLSVESIDEMVLSLADTPALAKLLAQGSTHLDAMKIIATEMKARIRAEIGEWITVSVGIAPNRYLAKVASGLEKPDGLRWITRENILEILSTMQLTDLCGIKEGNASRLHSVGIFSPIALYQSPSETLKRGLRSIVGHHWYLRLHGWEDGARYTSFGNSESFGAADNANYEEPKQKSFGQSYALPVAYVPTDPKLWQILAQLVMKMARRLRQDGCSARGVSVSLLYADHTHWHAQELLSTSLFADSDFFQHMQRMLMGAPDRAIRILAITCYKLEKDLYNQQSLLMEDNRKQNLTVALDAVHDRFGAFVVTPARMLAMERKVLDRIAFGKASL